MPASRVKLRRNALFAEVAERSEQIVSLNEFAKTTAAGHWPSCPSLLGLSEFWVFMVAAAHEFEVGCRELFAGDLIVGADRFGGQAQASMIGLRAELQDEVVGRDGWAGGLGRCGGFFASCFAFFVALSRLVNASADVGSHAFRGRRQAGPDRSTLVFFVVLCTAEFVIPSHRM
jgi:hypothetical protein